MSIYRWHSLIIKIITELSTTGNLSSRQQYFKLETRGWVMYLYYLPSIIHPLRFFSGLFLVVFFFSLFLREYISTALGTLLWVSVYEQGLNHMDSEFLPASPSPWCCNKSKIVQQRYTKKWTWVEMNKKNRGGSESLSQKGFTAYRCWRDPAARSVLLAGDKA